MLENTEIEEKRENLESKWIQVSLLSFERVEVQNDEDYVTPPSPPPIPCILLQMLSQRHTLDPKKPSSCASFNVDPENQDQQPILVIQVLMKGAFIMHRMPIRGIVKGQSKEHKIPLGRYKIELQIESNYDIREETEKAEGNLKVTLLRLRPIEGGFEEETRLSQCTGPPIIAFQIFGQRQTVDPQKPRSSVVFKTALPVSEPLLQVQVLQKGAFYMDSLLLRGLNQNEAKKQQIRVGQHVVVMLLEPDFDIHDPTIDLEEVSSPPPRPVSSSSVRVRVLDAIDLPEQSNVSDMYVTLELDGQQKKIDVQHPDDWSTLQFSSPTLPNSPLELAVWSRSQNGRDAKLGTAVVGLRSLPSGETVPEVMDLTGGGWLMLEVAAVHAKEDNIQKNEELVQEFLNYDINNNGWLLKDEFREIYQCYSTDEDESKLDQLLYALPTSKISFDEFVTIMQQLRNPGDIHDPW